MAIPRLEVTSPRFSDSPEGQGDCHTSLRTGSQWRAICSIFRRPMPTSARCTMFDNASVGGGIPDAPLSPIPGTRYRWGRPLSSPSGKTSKIFDF